MNPAAPRHLSMNLGQAAAVCLYQIAHGDSQIPASPQPPQAPAADLERITQLLAETLETSGYTRRHPATAREPNLRRLVRHMAITPADAPVWTGILRQLLHALTPK